MIALFSRILRRPLVLKNPLPSCFGSKPGPQARAENCCDDCRHQIPCLLPAPSESTHSPADMAAFGASEAAGYFYPGKDQAPERAAFCAGAAHAVAWL